MATLQPQQIPSRYNKEYETFDNVLHKTVGIFVLKC